VPTVVLPAGGSPIPDGGGRIALAFGGRRLGWLDVWGGGPVREESRGTLADAARSLAIILAASIPPPAARG